MPHDSTYQMGVFPGCFCPPCTRICKCFGECDTYPNGMEAQISGVMAGGCQATTTFNSGPPFFVVSPCVASSTGVADDCGEADNSDTWYPLTWEPVLHDPFCCLRAVAASGDNMLFTCHQRVLTVELQFCDCTPDTYIIAHYGASGGACADWALYGGDAVEAFEVLCKGGTVCPILTNMCDTGYNPAIPLGEYDPGGACEDFPMPICDFGVIGECGGLHLRFPL